LSSEGRAEGRVKGTVRLSIQWCVVSATRVRSAKRDNKRFRFRERARSTVVFKRESEQNRVEFTFGKIVNGSVESEVQAAGGARGLTLWKWEAAAAA
jgi:hypothetical protein